MKKKWMMMIMMMTTTTTTTMMMKETGKKEIISKDIVQRTREGKASTYHCGFLYAAHISSDATCSCIHVYMGQSLCLCKELVVKVSSPYIGRT